ncbi:hypothetical protein BC833DRAFT_596856 [Globomyces pollinis-pini]|nr:hypothetical protein BC833DRAFT_596856 [Globomyces pollinis-pini]
MDIPIKDNMGNLYYHGQYVEMMIQKYQTRIEELEKIIYCASQTKLTSGVDLETSAEDALRFTFLFNLVLTGYSYLQTYVLNIMILMAATSKSIWNQIQWHELINFIGNSLTNITEESLPFHTQMIDLLSLLFACLKQSKDLDMNNMLIQICCLLLGPTWEALHL